MRLGYDAFIKEKLKSVLKKLALQLCKILRSTKPFVSVDFCLACHCMCSSGLSTARTGTTSNLCLGLYGYGALIYSNKEQFK